MKVTELLEAVNAKIATDSASVADRVIASLTEKEVAARADAFIIVLGKLNEAKNAAKKIKPDGEVFAIGEDGLPAEKPTLTFSKAKLEERKKNADEVKRLTDALDKALEGDFSKVKEVAGKAKSAE